MNRAQKEEAIVKRRVEKQQEQDEEMEDTIIVFTG
jgi:hypothetical protein